MPKGAWRWWAASPRSRQGPTSAKLERERDLDFEAVKLEPVLRQMEIDREGMTSIVILAACRDNPLVRNLALHGHALDGDRTRAGTSGGRALRCIALGSYGNPTAESSASAIIRRAPER
jgi:hypothetical protein